MSYTAGSYNPPGVYIEEQPTVLNVTAGTAPSIVAITGPAPYRTVTEQYTFSSGGSNVLNHTGVDDTSIVVTSLDGQTTYAETTDWTHSGTTGPADQMTVTHESGGSIPTGTPVNITYSFKDVAYYTPQLVSDFEYVKNIYGDPLNQTTGAINSNLSLAAQVAFANGATDLILLAHDDASDFSAAYERLRTVYDMQLVVPLPVGQNDAAAVATALGTHVTAASNEDYFRVGIVGADTTDTNSADPTAIAAVSNSRVMAVWPHQINWYNPVLQSVQEVSGYFLAAAIAGKMASQAAQIPVTRKRIAGFVGVPADILETMTRATKNTWTEGGIAVVEPDRQGRLIVRHGVSTDPTSVLTREISITRGRDSMMRLILDSLEDAQVVGTAINEETPLKVKAIVQGALERSVSNGTIQAYVGLVARQQNVNEGGDPTVIEVKFEYKPTYPLNYVLVTFKINTETGDVTV